MSSLTKYFITLHKHTYEHIHIIQSHNTHIIHTHTLTQTHIHIIQSHNTHITHKHKHRQTHKHKHNPIKTQMFMKLIVETHLSYIIAHKDNY